uniref:Uncharacterized protein n=1 Tax=Oryza glumipatula TaxID=40148 RepID=A0A0D9Z8J5_9ORYZ
MRPREFAIADLLMSSCSSPHADVEGRDGEAVLRRAGHLDTAAADSPLLGLAPSAGGASLPKASRRHAPPSPWLTSASSSPTLAATTPSRIVSSRSSASPLTLAPAPAQRRRPSSPCPTRGEGERIEMDATRARRSFFGMQVEGRDGEAALRRACHLDTAAADSPPLGLAPSASGADLPKAAERRLRER